MQNAVASKKYLGDHVYAQYDGSGIILTVESSTYIEELIYLDPNVYFALLHYVSTLNVLAHFVGTEN